MVAYADPSEVREWASTLGEQALQCREMGHSWRPHTAAWLAKERCYERVLRCPRCRTKRVQLLSNTGAVISGHYDYPDGYLTPHLGRVVGEGRDVLRLESVLRVLTPVKLAKESA